MQNETIRMLDALGSSEDELRTLWKAKKYCSPLEVMQVLARKFCVDEQEYHLACRVIDATFDKDAATGFFAHNHGLLAKALAEDYVQFSGQSLLFSEIDVTNMAGLYKVLGEKNSPLSFKIARIMVEKYAHFLEEAGAKNISISYIGGDSFRIIASDLTDPKTINNVKQKTYDWVENFIEELKLSRLEHSKYKDIQQRSGVGIGIGSVVLNESFLAQDYERIDPEIEADKLRIGAKRIKAPHFETFPHSMEEIRKCNLGEYIIETLNKQYASFLKDIPPVALPIGQIPLEEGLRYNSVDARQAWLKQEASRYRPGFHQQLTRLVEKLYDAPDSITGLRDMRDLEKEINELKKHPKPYLIFNVGMQGRTAMIHRFGHIYARDFTKDMAVIVKEELQKLKDLDALKFTYFLGGSGAFKIITESPRLVDEAITRAADRIEYEINRRSIADWATGHGLSDSVSIPRHLRFADMVNPRDRTEQGVGLVYVASVELNDQQSANEILGELAKASTGRGVYGGKGIW